MIYIYIYERKEVLKMAKKQGEAQLEKKELVDKRWQLREPTARC